MYRLNVASEQIEECIKKGMFALSARPKISAGEILLLQLRKSDWRQQGKNGGRVQYALVFQHTERDLDGRISKEHWPNANKVWPWIIYSSAVLDVEPFSLEDLPLTRESHYQSQANPVQIDPVDEAVIAPYIKWPSAYALIDSTEAQDNFVYAISENAKTIEEISTEFALSEIKKWYPQADIQVMNHNNPGFDILVTQNALPICYVEVKGTQFNKPKFHLTETERKFSIINSSIYSLLVIWNINLHDGTYNFDRHDGEISVGDIIEPYTYLGQLKISKSA